MLRSLVLPTEERGYYMAATPRRGVVVSRRALKARENIAIYGARAARCDTLEALRRVDWDFGSAAGDTGIHTIHPYPAKFIPQIPRRLIELFHPAGDAVLLDPFCGSGTTLVEAIDAGIDAWGIDSNPLACLISRVKTTPIQGDLIAAGRDIILRARDMTLSGEVRVPAIPRLDHWFKPDIQQALAALVVQIADLSDPTALKAFQVALSSIIVRVSNQESDTRYAAIEKHLSANDVFEHFRNAVSIVNRAVKGLTDNLLRRLGKATVLNRDTVALSPEELPRNVGLVITSPPYPNAYEYWLYHKYRMYWLGMDPIAVREQEIGARPHFFRKHAQSEKDFERQMSACFQLLSQVMLPAAKACFLVGRSIIHGRVIDNTMLLARAAQAHGFKVEGTVERRIPAHRKTFNPAHGKINREHLVVFSRENAA